MRCTGYVLVRKPRSAERPSVEVNDDGLLGRLDELGRTRQRHGPPEQRGLERKPLS